MRLHSGAASECGGEQLRTPMLRANAASVRGGWRVLRHSDAASKCCCERMLQASVPASGFVSRCGMPML
jgi:hypothetical protein